MLNEIRWFASYIRRNREEPYSIRSIIEAEGGEVLAWRQLGTFRRSPFRGLRAYPIIYEFQVRYGQRHGCWFIRTSRGSPGFDWVWRDDYGYTSLPVDRPDATVDNDVVPVGYLSNLITVFGFIVIGVLAALGIYMFFLS